jgi:DNA-binding beta-propeller fold protein YncE
MLNKRNLILTLSTIAAIFACIILYDLVRSWMNSETPSSPINAAKARIEQLITKKPIPTPLAWEAQIRNYAEGLSDPFGIVIDKKGNTYIADAGEENRILKINSQGVVSVLAGAEEGFADTQQTNQAIQAKFNTPSGLAIDQQGNVYIADTGNNAIRKITPAGVVTTVAGNGMAGYVDGKAGQAQFNGPIGIAFDKEGRLIIADTYNDKIRVLTKKGEVITLAGSKPGYADGPNQQAQFNTPTNIVINSQGDIIVADTVNNAIRKISTQGMVSTIAMSEKNDDTALMYKPIGLAITHDDFLYVGDTSKGRILQITPQGELIGLTGVDIDIIPGDDTSTRLKKPVAIAINNKGELLVADADKGLVHYLGNKNRQEKAVDQINTISVAPFNHHPVIAQKSGQLWPVYPQNQVHEVVGTIGEVRGDYQGESRHHFHRGLDIQADMGKAVLVIANEKVSNPVPTWGANSINEGIRLGKMAYIHMKVGRDIKDKLVNDKMWLVKDDKSKLQQVRVKRGTRFQIGETLGTINSMYHVHLNHYEQGETVNPLTMGFIGLEDNIEPLIFGIEVRDQNEDAIVKDKKQTKLNIPRTLEKVSIIVDAADQTDGNAARRRLGLYELGFQILHADGTPVAGFEAPRNTIRFNQLPADDEAVKVAYASRSGITVHGNASTRFLYNVTNQIRNGHAIVSYWEIKDLAQGDYIIRIVANDYAGNIAKTGRDLLVHLE